mmetsp:Transcript_150147/g.262297  ORF Transcript_150147/g.262297 Transcript_150147/m.262297 type:complete len:237 (-) Transcript_150147:343-1053(-)
MPPLRRVPAVLGGVVEVQFRDAPEGLDHVWLAAEGVDAREALHGRRSRPLEHAILEVVRNSPPQPVNGRLDDRVGLPLEVLPQRHDPAYPRLGNAVHESDQCIQQPAAAGNHSSGDDPSYLSAPNPWEVRHALQTGAEEMDLRYRGRRPHTTQNRQGPSGHPRPHRVPTEDDRVPGLALSQVAEHLGVVGGVALQVKHTPLTLQLVGRVMGVPCPGNNNYRDLPSPQALMGNKRPC